MRFTDLKVPCKLDSVGVSVSEINCTIGPGQGVDLTLDIIMNKLPNPLNGTLKKSKQKALSFKKPVINITDPEQGIFIEGQGKIGKDKSIEGSTDGKNPTTGKRMKLTI